MSTILGLLGLDWAHLLGIVGAAGAALFGFLRIRQSGRDAQRLADLQQTAKDGQTGVQVRNEVARLPDAAVDQRVRKWERD